jgi:murein DD-endopeptidase MepM/ murein hydrolase activator NlpD
MKHIRLALLITAFLIPYTASANKNKKKDKKSTRIGLTEIGNINRLSVANFPLVDSVALQKTKAVIYPSTLAALEPLYLGAEDDYGDIPAFRLYPEWSNERVNPYGIRLENTEDTININVGTFRFPLPTHYRVTSEFGFRRGRFHYGIDLKLNIGDSVVSAFDGMVRIAKTQRGGYGEYVVVRHNNGLETVYGHLNKILVAEGQQVRAGETLGEGGNTGRSTGPHLHFEVRYLGQAINPRDMVDFADGRLCCHAENLRLTRGNFEYIKEVEAVKHWVVKSGHTLSLVASRTGVSINRLCSLNNIKRTSVLRIGQRIRYN